MALTWYSAATMEIWEAMDFGGGLGEVELLYPAKNWERTNVKGRDDWERTNVKGQDDWERTVVR